MIMSAENDDHLNRQKAESWVFELKRALNGRNLPRLWCGKATYLRARLRFIAVFGAQGADERIKEERQNRQPAYSQKYPACGIRY
jgi:hypothetical protein